MPRGGEEMTLRYYLYVSERKVDMLFAQMPRAKRDDLAAQFTVNLGVVASSVETRERSTLYTKVQAIEQYLRSEDMIGTVEEPRPYIEGSMMMQWGPMDGHNVVLFVGASERTIVALGGSPEHVVATSPVKRESGFGYVSSTPFLVEALSREIDGIVLSDYDRANMAALVSRGRDATVLALSHIEHLHRFPRHPRQRVAFVAKRLLWSQGALEHSAYATDGRAMLLGSPLYVVQDD
jgi:hypothetical protein